MDILATLRTDEQTFYAIGDRGWKLCSDNQADFFNFNALYTPEYILNAVKDLKAAQAIPNFDTRQAMQRSARNKVDDTVTACNILVQKLYTIIGRAFAGGHTDAMRLAAGSSYYASAASGNLNSADTLYNMVASFLGSYNDDLLSGNMPADFGDSFSEAQNRFTKTFASFTNAKDNAAAASVAKNTANAGVYAALMSMLADRKAIYMENPVKRKNFGYSELKRLVAGPGKTGVRFALKQAINQLPVSNAVIAMQPGNYTMYTEKNGVWVELPAADTYSYTVTAPGMTTMEGSFKVKAGSVRRANLVFAKAEAVKKSLVTDVPQPIMTAASEVS